MQNEKDSKKCPFNHKTCIEGICSMYNFDDRCCGFRTIMENTSPFDGISTSSYESIFRDEQDNYYKW